MSVCAIKDKGKGTAINLVSINRDWNDQPTFGSIFAISVVHIEQE